MTERDPRFAELDSLIAAEGRRESAEKDLTLARPLPAAAASVKRRTRILIASLERSYETRRLAYLLRGERWPELRIEAAAIRERERKARKEQAQSGPRLQIRKPMGREDTVDVPRSARIQTRRRA